MDVGFISDGSDAEGLLLAVRSILLHSVSCRLYVIDFGLSLSQQSQLKNISPNLVIVPVPKAIHDWLNIFREKSIGSSFSYARYAKLQLHNLLPNIKNLIYLETDVLVLLDITQLSCEFRCACPVSATIHLSQAESGRQRLGLKNHYFSAAVMVCELDVWRQRKVDSLFVDWYKANSPKLDIDAQDILNGVFGDDVCWIDKKWNISHWEVFRKHNQIGLDVKEWGIVHFGGILKPWSKNYVSDFVQNESMYFPVAELLKKLGFLDALKDAGGCVRADLLGNARVKPVALITTCDPLRFHLLKSFVEHYRLYGVEKFFINLHFDVGYAIEDQPLLLDEANRILSELGESIHSTYSCMFSAAATRVHHDKIQAQIGEQYPWVISSDIDEFYEFHDELKNLIGFMESHCVDYIRGKFVDRLARSGFPVINEGESLWKQFPLGSDMTKSVVGGWTDKVMLARARVPLVPGHHFVKRGVVAKPFGIISPVHHFKWDASVIPRLKRRLEEDWKSECPEWGESYRMLNWIEGRGMCEKLGLSIYDFKDDLCADEGGPHSTNSNYSFSRQVRAALLRSAVF